MRTLFQHLALLIGTLFAWMLLNDAVIQPWKIKVSAAGMRGREVFILGDSHGTRIFLPGACNLAQAGDPVWLQRATLKALQEEGVEPEVVVISVSPGSFAQHTADRFEGQRSFLGSRSSRMALYHHLGEGWPTARTEFRMWRLVGEMQLKPWRVPMKIGGYRMQRTTVKLDNAAERIGKVGMDDAGWFQEHWATTEALEAMVADANAGTFDLHLVGTPLHADFLGAMAPDGVARYRTWLRSLESEQVTYHAHEALALPDSMFRDLNHLNQNGIEAFTEVLLSEL